MEKLKLYREDNIKKEYLYEKDEKGYHIAIKNETPWYAEISEVYYDDNGKIAKKDNGEILGWNPNHELEIKKDDLVSLRNALKEKDLLVDNEKDFFVEEYNRKPHRIDDIYFSPRDDQYLLTSKDIKEAVYFENKWKDQEDLLRICPHLSSYWEGLSMEQINKVLITNNERKLNLEIGNLELQINKNVSEIIDKLQEDYDKSESKWSKEEFHQLQLKINKVFKNGQLINDDLKEHLQYRDGYEHWDNSKAELSKDQSLKTAIDAYNNYIESINKIQEQEYNKIIDECEKLYRIDIVELKKYDIVYVQDYIRSHQDTFRTYMSKEDNEKIYELDKTFEKYLNSKDTKERIQNFDLLKDTIRDVAELDYDRWEKTK